MDEANHHQLKITKMDSERKLLSCKTILNHLSFFMALCMNVSVCSSKFAWKLLATMNLSNLLLTTTYIIKQVVVVLDFYPRIIECFSNTQPWVTTFLNSVFVVDAEITVQLKFDLFVLHERKRRQSCKSFVIKRASVRYRVAIHNPFIDFPHDFYSWFTLLWILIEGFDNLFDVMCSLGILNTLKLFFKPINMDIFS